MYQTPKPVRVMLGVICAAVAISALGGGAAAMLLPDKPAWTALGFEIVTLVTAVLGLVMATDKFRDGPGMALACIAGTIVVAAGLGYLAGGSKGQTGDSQVRLLLAGRVLAALALAGLAAALVLGRRRGQWKLAIHGAALAVAGPALGLLHRQTDGNWFGGAEGVSLGMTSIALLTLTGVALLVGAAFTFVKSGSDADNSSSVTLGRAFIHLGPIVLIALIAWLTHGHLNTEITGPMNAARVVLSLLLLVFLGGWFCGGVNMLIRAFEMGRTNSNSPTAAARTAIT